MKTALALLLISLSVSGNADINARDALIEIMNNVGNDGETVDIIDVGEDDAFVLGLEAGDFELIESAAMTLEASADGSAKTLIVASGRKDAKKLYEKMWKNYEFPACDNAEKIIFLKSGNVIASFKGKGENVDSYARAYGDFYGAEAMKILKNPAKK